MGCTPFAITSHGTNGSLCVDTFNLDAQLFNKKLVSLVDQLNKELIDAKFIYVDSFGIGSGDPSLAGMISQTSSYFSSLSIYRLLIFEQIFLVIIYYVIYAFQVSRLQMLGVVQLMKLGNVFVPKLHANRSEYTFWDSFHPTEAANKVTAARSYQNFLKTDTYPMDISHLIKL